MKHKKININHTELIYLFKNITETGLLSIDQLFSLNVSKGRKRLIGKTSTILRKVTFVLFIKYILVFMAILKGSVLLLTTREKNKIKISFVEGYAIC